MSDMKCSCLKKTCYFRNFCDKCAILIQPAPTKDGSDCVFRKTKEQLIKQDKMDNDYIRWYKTMGLYKSCVGMYYREGAPKDNNDLLKESKKWQTTSQNK